MSRVTSPFVLPTGVPTWPHKTIEQLILQTTLERFNTIWKIAIDSSQIFLQFCWGVNTMSKHFLGQYTFLLFFARPLHWSSAYGNRVCLLWARELFTIMMVFIVPPRDKMPRGNAAIEPLAIFRDLPGNDSFTPLLSMSQSPFEVGDTKPCTCSLPESFQLRQLPHLISFHSVSVPWEGTHSHL